MFLVQSKRSAFAAIALGAVLGSGALVALPDTADARVNTVCHRGASSNPPIVAYEQGLSQDVLHPGDCTTGDVPIVAIRPVSGTSAYVQWTGGRRQTLNNSTHTTATLGRSATVLSSRYNLPGGLTE